jgi:hypothetical protein
MVGLELSNCAETPSGASHAELSDATSVPSRWRLRVLSSLVVTTPAGADILRTCRSEHLDGGSAQHCRPEQIASCGPVPAVRLRGRSLPGAVSQLRVATPATASVVPERPAHALASAAAVTAAAASGPAATAAVPAAPAKSAVTGAAPGCPAVMARATGSSSWRGLVDRPAAHGAPGPATAWRKDRPRGSRGGGSPLPGGRRRHLALPQRIV